MAEINRERTRAYDALISNFDAFLRACDDKPADMVQAAGNRRAIGKWATERALRLLVAAP